MERTGPPGSNQFRPISWEQALKRVASTLVELRSGNRAGSVAWLCGDVNGIMDELLQRFTRLYGTPHLWREGYGDGSDEVMKLSQGIDARPAFDLAGSDMVLSFGAALSEAWWCLPQAAQARNAEAARRPHWVQIDVRHSRTAARADEWLPVRPGTYGALAIGLAYVLLKEGLYDAEEISAHVSGIEDWKDGEGRVFPGFRSLVLRHGRTEDIAAHTGLPAESIVSLAKAFGAARRPVAVWDQSIAWRTGGLPDALAIHALNILAGALNRPGGVLVQPSIAGSQTEQAARGTAGATGEPNVGVTARTWAARVAAGREPSLQALFLYYSNPIASAPDPAEVAQAMARIPLVVSFSPFLDESARHAHLVLPDHTYLERWQDAPAPSSVPIPVWGVVQPLSKPLRDTRATGDVILDFASRLGGEVAAGLPQSSMEAMVGERGRALADARGGSVMVGAFRREELREMESRGWWLSHGKSKDEFWTSIRDSGGWFDPIYDYNDWSAASQLPDGNVWIFPAAARIRIAAAAPGLVAGFLPIEEEETRSAADERYPLTLIPYRVLTLASGNTALMPWLLEHLGLQNGAAWETWAEINPETGRELGLLDGQPVLIESEAGNLQARLRFFAGAQPGAVNVPYGLHTGAEGWGRATGANPLQAVGNRRDPSTGLPDWYSTRVRVIPV
jgi:anaerobic selenocysteine-containing dehydrogenase